MTGVRGPLEMLKAWLAGALWPSRRPDVRGVIGGREAGVLFLFKEGIFPIPTELGYLEMG